MKCRWGITTSIKSDFTLLRQAKELALFWQTGFYPREGKSLAELKEEMGLEYLLVLDRNQRLYSEEPFLEWHPSMAVVRLRALYQGKKDNFLRAASILPGDKVLDCTLGLAADALLAAWAAGEGGCVLGLEASPVIAAITQWGLGHQAGRFACRKAPVAQLASRISVLSTEALPYLREMSADSWDVVCFDPMFQASQTKSSAINCLRPMACYSPVDEEVLGEALRVCRRRVVMKERSFSKMFEKLGCPQVKRSKYGPVAYGVWEKES